jgi:hypothetical protein
MRPGVIVKALLVQILQTGVVVNLDSSAKSTHVIRRQRGCYHLRPYVCCARNQHNDYRIGNDIYHCGIVGRPYTLNSLAISQHALNWTSVSLRNCI